MLRMLNIWVWLKVLTLIVIFSLVFTSCAPADETGVTDEMQGDITLEEEKIVLIYADPAAPTGIRESFLSRVLFEEINKQTDGRVEIEEYFGGSLVGGLEVKGAIRDGVVDIGYIYPEWYPAHFFVWSALNLFPEGPEKGENIYLVWKTIYEEIPQFMESIERQNQKVLFQTSGFPIVTGAAYPIEKAEDLRGHKWRAASRWHLMMLENIGAEPISLAWDEIYTGLQTGTIDGVLTNYDGFYGSKFYETGPYIIVHPSLWFSVPLGHNINLDTWNALPEDVQDGILRAVEIAEEEWSKFRATEFERIVDYHRDVAESMIIGDSEDVSLFTNPELFERMKNIWIEEAVSDHGFDREEAEDILNKIEKIINDVIEMERS